MSYQFPEIKTDKTVNLTANVETADDWSNPKCNADEIYNPSATTKSRDSKQSPININTEAVQECHLLCKMEINYKPSKCHVERTEQGIIKFNWDKGSYLNYNNNSYELKYIQIHTPSLHHIDNKSSEMEINLYHFNHQNQSEFYQEESGQYGAGSGDIHKSDMKKIEDKLLPKELKDSHPHTENNANKKGYKVNKGVILSILVNHSTEASKNGETQASRPNMFVSQFIHNKKFLDLKTKVSKSTKHETYDIEVHPEWNVKDLLPKSKAYYTYDGSIPNPPCVEDIKWVVMEQHIEIIEEFINILREEGNIKGYRDIHPLNNRVVFYNNNIVTSTPETKDDSFKKSDEVKKILAPIRIRVEDRTGYDYRKQSEKIISSYRSGNRSNYLSNKVQLDELNKEWDRIGKIGYEDRFVLDMIEQYLDGKNLNKPGEYFIKHLIFDKIAYDGDYFNLTLPILDLKRETGGILKNSDGKSIEISTQVPDMTIEQLVKELNEIFGSITSEDIGTGDDFTYIKFKEAILAKMVDDKPFDKIKDNFLSQGKGLEKYIFIFYILLDWDIDANENAPTILSKIDSKENIDKFMIGFWAEYLSFLYSQIEDVNKKREMEKIIFKSRSDDLDTTINNHVCQTWGSNKVHHEHSIWNTFSKTPSLRPEGYTFEEIEALPKNEEIRIKNAIRDGLLDKVGEKYIPNNKCRNPNGSATAAWCYTTNPKVRWDYCMKPDISFKTRKIVLVILFLLILYLSYYTVKLIFQYNMFNKFMAMLTGGKMSGGSGSSGTSGTTTA